MHKQIIFLAPILLLFSSCVTPKMYNNLYTDNESTKSLLIDEKKNSLKLNSKIEELESEVSSLNTQILNMRSDANQNEISLLTLQNKYNSLSDSYDLLTSKNSREISDKAQEIKRLLSKLEMSQSELFKKEDELSKLSNSLEIKEAELKSSQTILDSRSVRVAELESIINKKDSIVTNLKNSISQALIGLEGDGLSVEKRSGKVYISLEEDLLFASGKYEINSGGLTTLNKLAIALASQKDLEILVEGHTDSVPFKGKGLVTDNWDLSVMRATNVVKVLTQNSNLNPFQLTAAGRGEFIPIASNKTSAGRSANRRIEMILSPNLDDLFKLLDD